MLRTKYVNKPYAHRHIRKYIIDSAKDKSKQRLLAKCDIDICLNDHMP